MAHTLATVLVVGTTLVAGTMDPLSAADAPLQACAPRIPRVRDTGDPLIAALVREATERSATFRRLVDTIDATDGIVYVEQGRCGHHVRACLELTVIVAGPHRILRIVVDTHRDHGELLASIGHELQHAVEALSDPHVTDNSRIYFFFGRIGSTSEGRFETTAAIQAGLEVLAELGDRARQSRVRGSTGILPRATSPCG
jgi:hypothetical protein